MMPRACAAARPSAIAAAISTASRHGSAPRFRRTRSVSPSSSSITANGHTVDDGQLVNRQDARVRQRRHRAGLGLEAPPHLGIGGDVSRP